MPINAGQIREAIKDLPDDAPTNLMIENDPDPFVEVDFLWVAAENGALVIHAEVVDDGYDDDEEIQDVRI